MPNILPYNYDRYFKTDGSGADLTFSASETNSNYNNDYYYDDEEDSCEFCKRKSQRITFRDFCKNEIGKLLIDSIMTLFFNILISIS